MYKVLCDNALMCDTRVEDLALLNPVVELEENKAGSFVFKIPPKHPFYNLIKRKSSVIQVFHDDDLIFSGMCVEVETDFYKTRTVTCEGELAYLNDSIQRPFKYSGYTVRNLLVALIAKHNAQVDAEKQFQVGMITVTDKDDSITAYTNMESTMEVLKKVFADNLGGFFRIRHKDGIKYLDYLSDALYTSSQVIRLGENLINFKSNIDSSDICTAIIPLGTKLEKQPIDKIEQRLTIASVNDGKDYLYNEDAVANFGWIFKTVEWDNVTIAADLKTKGQKYLSDYQFENMTIEAQAVDLSHIDSSIDRFNLSDKIRVVSKPHGLDKFFRLTKQTINLLNPESDRITLGKEEQIPLSARTNKIKDSIKTALDDIDISDDILEEAKANATQLITNAMGGYVYKTNNELLIMDTDRPETASRLWRWNINGLGYSSTGYNGTYGLAMTMDGKIVADFITTGTMQASRIKGGTLSLGGSGNGNGQLSIKNASGVEIGSWNNSGITATAGTIGGFTIGSSSLYNQKTSLTDTTNGVYLGTDGIAIGSIFNASSTGGKIGGFTIGTSSIYNGKSKFSDSTTNGVYLGTDGIAVGQKFKASASGNVEAKDIYLNDNVYFDNKSFIFKFSDTTVELGTYKIMIEKDLIASSDLSVTGDVTITKDLNAKNGTFTGNLTAKGATFTSMTTGDATIGGVSSFTKTAVKIGSSTATIGFFGGLGSLKKTCANSTYLSSTSAQTVGNDLNTLKTALRAYGLIG